MASLNQLAEQVLLAINQPYDYVTHKRIKDLILQARAERIRQSIEKNGIDNLYVQVYHPELIKVDIADSCYIDIGCDILRTKNKIPTPLRYKSDVPFISVASIDEKITITHATTMQDIITSQYSKFMRDIPRYLYYNGYIYIYNVKRMKYIAVRAVYENPNIVYDGCSGICYNDDMEFPMPLDMVNSIIKEILSSGILIAVKNMPEHGEVGIKKE